MAEEITIEVLTGPGCPHCHSTKTAFSEAGVDFQEKDVTSLSGEEIEALRNSGLGRLPVVTTPEGTWAGLDKDNIEATVAKYGTKASVN